MKVLLPMISEVRELRQLLSVNMGLFVNLEGLRIGPCLRCRSVQCQAR